MLSLWGNPLPLIEAKELSLTQNQAYREGGIKEAPPTDEVRRSEGLPGKEEVKMRPTRLPVYFWFSINSLSVARVPDR